MNSTSIASPNPFSSGGGGGGDTFNSDQLIVLAPGKTYGKYINGQTAPWNGLTSVQAIIDAVTEYIQPVFNSFSVQGQSANVEIGTTLSGSRTFTWSINPGSGTVGFLDILDVTAGNTILANVANDGSENVGINTLLLNTENATQQWRGRGLNTSPVGNFLSSIFTVTCRFNIFLGPTSTTPTTSAQVRSLPQNSLYSGPGNIILNTGNTQTRFVIAMPPGKTFSQIIDLDALNANITSSYLNIGTLNVQDAGGTNRVYTLFELSLGAPYSSNHRHQITLN